MLEVKSNGGEVSVQEYLGYVATCRSDFKIKIPNDDRVYEAIYDFIPAELSKGQLIGHIVDMNGEPNFIVSRIVYVDRQLEYGNDSCFSYKYNFVRSITVLHRGDERNVQDLLSYEWDLKIDDITCILDRVEK